MKTAIWYFDFISPFAYLQSEQLDRLQDRVQLRRVPLLFAGLLKHWDTKGPAELAAKRRFTYRQVLWLARRHEIPLRMPPVHPFNPLAVLRLALALDSHPQVVRTIFRFIWQEGRDPNNPEDWQALIQRLGLSDFAVTTRPEVKNQLRENTETAIVQGVFGVPTLLIDNALFWGFDATEMAYDYLADPQRFNDAEMRRISELPVGVQRR